MGKSKEARSSRRKRPTFAITCALFAIIAFCQLMTVGVALAVRAGETHEVVRYVETQAPRYIPRDEEVKPRSYEEIMRATQGSFDPDTLSAPVSTPPTSVDITPAQAAPSGIADPVVEKLVNDARELQLKGDLARAILKLEEAQSLDANEPAVTYHLGQVHEDMGLWERAGDYYEQLFTAGHSAGIYYHRAAEKLKYGLNPAQKNLGLLSLGHILQRPDKSRKSCHLVIPTRAAPNREIDPNKIEIKVHFYDIVDNKDIKPKAPNAKSRITWLEPPLDWDGAGEEALKVSYTIPKAGLADEHLFGHRQYYGQVVELYYDGELLDQQAFPRKLNATHARFQNDSFTDFLPGGGPDFNPDNPLLPLPNE